MYAFLLRQWQLGKVTETQLEYAVTKGWISEAEKEQILAKTRIKCLSVE